MPDYDTSSLGRGVFAGLDAYATAVDEQKTRAREFKALQEFADATGIAGKDQTTVLDLESLKGLVRGGEAKRAQQEQQRKAQMEQAQFDNLQKHQADMLGVSRQGMALEGMRTLGGLFNQSRDNARADAHLSLAERGYTDQQARYGRQDQQAGAQQQAVGGFVRDFNQFAEGPQFNGTGMQRPMGQFEAYRRALGANPRAVTPQMMDDLGRMAVSEDRLNQPGAAADHVPKLIELGGIKTIYSPKGGQFQIAPTGELPSNLPEVPGHVAVPNGRGGVVYVKTGETGESDEFKQLASTQRSYLSLLAKTPPEQQNNLWRQIASVQRRMDELSSGSKPAPAPAAATPQSKAARANALAAQNPGWTREQIIEAVNREFSR
jgi:hypothetical protein